MVGKMGRPVMVVTFMVACVLFLARCMDGENKDSGEKESETGSQFAGSESCAECHKNIYKEFKTTRHNLSSRPATEEYIKGSFEPGSNVFGFNPALQVAMEKRSDGFYQVVYQNGCERRAEKMDIVIGSGVKGQSYLHWNKDELAQLPITYFTAAHQWSNSPGYPDRLIFNRPITSRCLECHTSYVRNISSANKEREEFDHEGILYGVSCEKCHGPAARHVEFHKKNPKEGVGRFIVNPAQMSRQQNLDFCALCHGGRLNKIRPSFSFKPGDKLSDFFVIDSAGRNAADIDVHGNQFGLLAASKCFTMSKNMTCATCHDSHKNERGNFEVFSKRCMSCHDGQHVNSCTMEAKLGEIIKSNCIDCHMPEQRSMAVAVFLQGSEIPERALMRTHLIKIYPEQTDEIIKLFREKQSPRKQLSK